MAQQDFRSQQKKFRRVRTAYADKEKILAQLLADKGIGSFEIELFLRIIKAEQLIEVWAKPPSSSRFMLLITYPFAGYSGRLGPKMKQGDGQVPEGFYHINRFNPESNFYLSLGLDYPNKADRKRAGAHDPGGAIFIHGNRVTIGCIPITDDKIKELYLLAVEARTHGQISVPVHIFPFRFTENWQEKVTGQYKDNPELLDFWSSLAPVFFSFDQHEVIPSVTITSKGSYQLKPKSD
ncbi:L,D-transpeptidase family protein [bacterium]|nr:L,D-transpeptidase family protein [bacterium]